MLTADGCRARRARLWEALEPRPDWILLAEPRHLMYFASFYADPFIFRTQNALALLVLGRDGSSTLIVDNMLRAYGERAHVDRRVVADWYTGKGSAPERQSVLVTGGLREIQQREGSAFAFDQMTPSAIVLHLSQRGGPAPLSVNDAAARLMRRKEDDELAVLRRAIAAAEHGFVRAREGIHAGMSELHAYSLVSDAVLEHLGEQALVYGDFASGPRAEAKGGQPTARVIERGDLFILDYSVVLYGYRGDFTNTWVIDGQPTTRQRELADACLAAMQAGESRLRPGTRGAEVHAALTDSFARASLADAFPHHSGHGIGLGHPDPPYFTPHSDDVIVERDVVTLEPGLYVQGVGGMRFERNYVIAADGFELLTHHTLGL
jgi:Xaa-Pro aminopeptidase